MARTRAISVCIPFLAIVLQNDCSYTDRRPILYCSQYSLLNPFLNAFETMSRSRNPRDARPEVGPHIGALLRMAWQRVRARIYSGVQHDGYRDLNPAHVALFRFETIDGRRPTQVAESMQITKQSVNDLIRDLQRHGYAQYRPDPSDHRARLIHLTTRGRRLEQATRKYAVAAEKELEQELGRERFRELRSILLKISKLSP